MGELRFEWMNLPQNSGILAGLRGPINARIGGAVMSCVRQDNERIAANILKMDAEMRKGYAILDSQWTEFYRYYFVLGRGPSKDLPLSSMLKTCLNNLTTWQRLRDRRSQLAGMLSMPRTFEATVKLDHPPVDVFVRITVPGQRKYESWKP